MDNGTTGKIVIVEGPAGRVAVTEADALNIWEPKGYEIVAELDSNNGEHPYERPEGEPLREEIPLFLDDSSAILFEQTGQFPENFSEGPTETQPLAPEAPAASPTGNTERVVRGTQPVEGGE